MPLKNELGIIDRHHIINEINYAGEQGKTPALAYLRVSTLKQEERGMSLDDQEAQCDRYCNANNIHIVLSFRCAESARKKDRRVFNQMLKASLCYGLKDLVMRSSNRMSRNTPDYARIEELIDEEQYNIHFFSTHKIINRKSPFTDRMLLGIETAVNKARSDEIAEYSREMHRFKHEAGIAPGPPAYGYTFDRNLQKHMFDAAVESKLRYFFDEFDTFKYSLHQYADHLNKLGHLAPKGGKWSAKIVRRILINVRYHGEYSFHGGIHPGSHEPYYAKARYIERMKHLSGRTLPRKNTRLHFPLGNMVKCACGLAMYGDAKKGRYIYYVHKCPESGRQMSIPQEKLMLMFDEVMRMIAFSDEFAENLKAVFRVVVQEKDSTADADKQAVGRKIGALLAKRARFYELYGAGGFDPEELREQVNMINTQIRSLEDQKQKIAIFNDDLILHIAGIIDTIHKLPQIHLASGGDKKAAILRESIESAVLDAGTLTIKWQKPLAFILKPEILEHKFEFGTLWVNEVTNLELVKEILLIAAWEVALWKKAS